MKLRVHLASGNTVDVDHPIHRNEFSAHADEETADVIRSLVFGTAPLFMDAQAYPMLGGCVFDSTAISAIEVL